ncbi:MAG: hypothetical protein E3K37_01350 [Candidatus Kuenenia sp.]|nr:hypothetical protein [Candidatus Kuenenia hertensis]
MTTCTTKDLAGIYGCSVQYIGELIKKGLLPKPVKQNCHDVVKAATAIVDIIKSEFSEAQSGIDAENLRLVKARARKAEFEVLELTKILVPAKDVESAAFEIARQVQDALLNIPDRLAALLAAETDKIKIHEMLEKEIDLALEKLSGKYNDNKRKSV